MTYYLFAIEIYILKYTHVYQQKVMVNGIALYTHRKKGSLAFIMTRKNPFGVPQRFFIGYYISLLCNVL